MSIDSENFNIGDWVLSYSKGIWQIYRILDIKDIHPKTKNEVNKQLIFSKRIVSDKFKRSFREECCDKSFVEKLNDELQIKLDCFIENNQKAYKDFLNYKPKPIDLICSRSINDSGLLSMEDIESEIDKEKKMTECEIDILLSELNLKTGFIPLFTFQFVSRDHECRDNRLVYSFLRVLPNS